MIFGGIQKLTILDYPDKTACTLFTSGCNFRCPFCQNSSLLNPVTNEERTGNRYTINAVEVLDFLKTRKGLLDGVCISGGEPLMHDKLYIFLNEVKSLGFLVKIDTNGGYPKNLKKLISSGVIDYVALDIKNSPEKYAETIGLPEYDIAPVEESITLLYSSTLKYEFRTTVVREFHTGDDLITVAKWLPKKAKYILQGFSDSNEVLQHGLHAYSDDEMRKFLQRVLDIQPEAELRGI